MDTEDYQLDQLLMGETCITDLEEAHHQLRYAYNKGPPLKYDATKLLGEEVAKEYEDEYNEDNPS